MIEWLYVALICWLPGLCMPIGAFLASIEKIRPYWLENEFRHFLIALGGGALLAAVALVLIPHGLQQIPDSLALASFTLGGITFMGIDIFLAKKNTKASNLIAMLADFIPEALALGATFALEDKSAGLTLALLIAVQNLPESFNAYREITDSKKLKGRSIIIMFFVLSLLGPILGLNGFYFFSDYMVLTGAIMLFSSGGILYIIFEDIAPQAHLEKSWAPPLGAVIGFLIGLTGHILIT